jgi:hypothetical protein
MSVHMPLACLLFFVTCQLATAQLPDLLKTPICDGDKAVTASVHHKGPYKLTVKRGTESFEFEANPSTTGTLSFDLSGHTTLGKGLKAGDSIELTGGITKPDAPIKATVQPALNDGRLKAQLKTPIYEGAKKIQATVHNAGEYTLTITRTKGQPWDVKARPEPNGLLTFDLSTNENETVQAGVKRTMSLP